MDELITPRLTLLPLTLEQLETGLRSLNDLSASVGVNLVEALFNDAVERAVRLKIEKMKRVSPAQHPWFTYFLIVINVEQVGAGMAGFKGSPDERGEVEIGYGIHPFFGGRGYMSEAVQALVAWAFSHPGCRAITACGVLPDNLASQKVLLKNGFVEAGQGESGINFRLNRTNL